MGWVNFEMGGETPPRALGKPQDILDGGIKKGGN